MKKLIGNKLKMAFCILISIFSLTLMAAENELNSADNSVLNNLHWFRGQLNLIGPIACSEETCNEFISSQCVEVNASQMCEKLRFINVILNDAIMKSRVSYLSSPMKQSEFQDFSSQVNNFQLRNRHYKKFIPFYNTARVIDNPSRYLELTFRFPLDIFNLIVEPYNQLTKDNQTHLQKGSKYSAGSNDNSITILNSEEFYELGLVIYKVTKVIFPEFNHYEYREMGYPPTIEQN